MIDAKGATTTYGYDAAGRMLSRTDPLGAALVCTYDPLGNKVSQRNRTDPLLTVSVAWTYDGAGRILTRTADGVATSYVYDANGNQLSATTGGQTITATYDRLNRPLTIDDEDAGTTADTTYTYSLTSPAWTDPSGSYTATIDRFDRATAVNDPVNATDFLWTYRADGQPSAFAQPNGNTTALAYDLIGRLTSKDTGSLALYDWTYNRAGQVLTESSTITSDPSNGTVTYAYDPLERLTSATLAGATTAYGWAAVPNRTSVQTGAGPAATTTYDAADRPTSGANPPATYTSDPDGRLTAGPGTQYSWDHLGRLTTVKDGAGTTLATYSYDPLDRLRLVDDGAGNRIRFRYVGLTTAVAQWLDDATGTVTRSVANGWTGERLADWTGSGADLRIYGSNAHHDTTWLATGTGSVSAALRYDPWGSPRGPVPTGYSPFRFQGAWSDATTNLAWVVTRWYAPALGRFISEDSLLGTPADPPSRHLYAYAEGEPIGRWDPDGRCALAATDPLSLGGQAAACLVELGAKAATVAVGVGVFIITMPFLVTGDTVTQTIPRPATGTRYRIPPERLNRTDSGGDSIVWRNMESWHTTATSASGGIHQNCENERSGWWPRRLPSGAIATGPSPTSPASSASAPSRSANGSTRPRSMPAIGSA